MIWLDLEDMGTNVLRSGFAALQDACSEASVVLRAYAASQDNLASLATNTVDSSAKYAVDQRIASDIGQTSLMAGPGSRFLLVSKDLTNPFLGKALAGIRGVSTDLATLDTPLPRHWRRVLGVASLSRIVATLPSPPSAADSAQLAVYRGRQRRAQQHEAART